MSQPLKRKTRSTSNKGKDDLKKIYCRKCQNFKTATQFYEATNTIIDSNGKLSVCKDCCAELYDKMYVESSCDETVAIYKMCELLDIVYLSDAAKAAISQTKTVVEAGKAGDRMFGYYKSKINSFAKNRKGMDALVFKFSDTNPISYYQLSDEGEQTPINDAEMSLKWGPGFTSEEYAYLEVELSNWKASHKCSNHSELTLLKEICIKSLEIRRARISGGDTKSLIDQLQALMKTASVDPAKANVADSGKSLDAYGLWNADIEQYEPSEYFADKELFKDFDGIGKYWNNHILRALKNLLTGSRDFNIDGVEYGEDDE